MNNDHPKIYALIKLHRGGKESIVGLTADEVVNMAWNDQIDQISQPFTLGAMDKLLLDARNALSESCRYEVHHICSIPCSCPCHTTRPKQPEEKEHEKCAH